MKVNQCELLCLTAAVGRPRKKPPTTLSAIPAFPNNWCSTYEPSTSSEAMDSRRCMHCARNDVDWMIIGSHPVRRLLSICDPEGELPLVDDLSSGLA